MDEELQIIVQNMLDAGESEENIAKVIQAFKPEKKKPSPSTAPKQKSDSASGAGSSGAARTNPFAGQTVEFDEKSLKQSPQEKAQEEKIRAAGKAIKPAVAKQPPVDNSSQYPEGSMAWTQEKLKQDPLYTENYNKLKQAEQLAPERIREIEQEVDDEIGNKGIVNTLKSAGRGLSSFFTNFTFNTNPLTEERAQAKKELQQQKVKITPDALNEKAREIAVKKRIDSERNSRVESYLTTLEDEETEFGTTKREDLYRFMVAENSSLTQKDKVLLKKQEILKPALESNFATATTLAKEIKALQEDNQPIPEELNQRYLAASENYDTLLKDAIANQEEFASNQEQLGDSQENLDLLKRNYGNWKNFEDNALASVMDLYAGAAGFGDYASTMTGRPLDALAARAASKKLKEGAEDIREGIMKPKSIEDVNSWEDFGRWTANTGASQVPILALAATGAGGISAIGLSSTGQKFEEMQQEIESGQQSYNALQMGLIPAAFGATEAGSAYVDRLLFKQAGRVIRSATEPERKLIAKGFANQLLEGSKNVAKGTAMEATEEAGTQVAQNVLDKYAAGKDVGVWDNVIDAAAAGAMFGAMVPLGGQIIATAAKPFSTDNTLEKSAAQLEQLKAQLNNPELSEASRQVVEKQYKITEDKLNSEIEKAGKKISSLDDKQFAEVLDIEKKQNGLRESAREIEGDPSIDERAKKLLTGNLKKEYDANEQRRLAIINGTDGQAVDTGNKDAEGTAADNGAGADSERTIQEDKVKELIFQASTYDSADEFDAALSRKGIDITDEVSALYPEMDYLQALGEIVSGRAPKKPKDYTKGITVFHGTEMEFDKADASKSNTSSQTGVAPGHIFYTDDKEVANSYGKNIKEERIAPKNPLVLDANGSNWNDITFEGDSKTINEIASLAEERGFDSLIVENIRDTGDKAGDKPGGFKTATTIVTFNKNETAQGSDTEVDGDLQPGTTELGQDGIPEPDSTEQQGAQPAAVSGAGQSEVKRIKVPAVRNAEFDITFDDNGGIAKIISAKDGREVPKFTERVNKRTGKKSLVRNGNYSSIESAALGTETNNKLNEERKAKVKEAVSTFEPYDPYSAALQYFATGGRVSRESASKESGMTTKEAFWAAGMKPEKELPSIERASEIISEGTDLDQMEVRDALIDIVLSKSGVSQIEDEIVSLRDQSLREVSQRELDAFKSTLSEAELALFDAIQAEDGYISELSDEEAIAYYQQQYEDYEQGKRATEPGQEADTQRIPEDGSDEAPPGEQETGPGNAEDGGVTEQASMSRNKNLITERIKPERRAPKNTPKKLNQIIADVSKGLKATLIYGRSRRSGSIGTYNPSNALIRIRNAGDIDTVAHEIGHMIDDRYNLLDTIPSEGEMAAIRELNWFAERGGSNPPAKMSPAKKAKYLEREGMGEFFRAYVANPTQTKIIAPALTEHFENTLDEKAMGFVQQFSDDYLDFANATAGEKLMSNIEDLDAKEAAGFKQWLDKFKSEDGKLQITPWDNLSAHVLNSLGIANKAFDFLTKQAGETNLLPEKNFEMMARLFAGVNGKTNRILAAGMVDGKNKKVLDKDGNAINVEWLLEPLDNTSEATVKSDMEEVIRYLVAERTLEYAKKFGRLDNLTGIGGGIDADIDVAQEYLNDFDQLKTENKEKYDRIKEAAKRYRKFADLGLRYAVDKGRLSEASYQQIKESNQYYVSLARVMENAPMDEQEPFFNENGGGIASVKDVIKKAKGGTAFIQNPYISLLQNTVNIIKEADRNEVLSSFIEPMQKLREMGDGTPIDFSQVARPAATKDKNVKTIYKDGNAERWQFAPEIFNALTSMEKVTDSPYTELLSKPANLIRFTVTNFPTFALRNAVRDTTSRMIVSRTNSGFKDLVQSATDKELFELYGGSQAGFYHTNKEGYQQRMKESIKEITKSGGIVLNPRSLYRGYRKLLERGENLNRIAEFKSAYRKAKAKGLDDYNAGLYAAYQARDLMDFAVAGHTIRQLNRIIPFLNAGVQGLARSAKAAKENPTGFAVRTALYTVLPTLLFRQMITAMGDDEEYEELPAYQRDLFWNFKTPFTGDVWISIPKPFEQGMISSAIDRGYSQAAGSETAWDGFGGSVVKSLTPFDESSLLGGIKPFYEVASNYNYFTDRNIVPAWEEGKMMELRAGKEKASRAGKGIAAAFDEAGMTVDPRKVDHLLTGYGTYMADWGLALGDLGVENSRFKFGPSKTGFAKDVPINNSVSVTAVYKLATELGKWSSKDVKGLRNLIEQYYLEEDSAKREVLSKQIYSVAKDIRKEFEEIKAGIESGEAAEKKTLTPEEIRKRTNEALKKARERK